MAEAKHGKRKKARKNSKINQNKTTDEPRDLYSLLKKYETLIGLLILVGGIVLIACSGLIGG